MTEKLSKKSKKKQNVEKVKRSKRDLLVISDRCKNCSTPLMLDQQFCSKCGAKRILNRLNTRNLLEDFTERFLNIENAFLRTFLALWTQPEDVINGYIDGLRKRYMSAFSYFAVALTLGSIYMFVFRHWFMDDVGNMNTLFQEGFNFGALSADPQAQPTAISGLEEIMEIILDYNSFFSFLLIPFYAIISKLVFWNYKQVNFIEHVVIYLYSYSQTQIVTSVLMILFGWSAMGQIIVSTLISALPFFYTAYVLYRVFDLDIKRLLLKTLLFLAIVVPIGIIFIGIVGGAMYSMGVFDPFIEGIKEHVELGKARKATIAIKDSLSQDSVQRSIEKIRDTISDIKIFKDSLP